MKNIIKIFTITLMIIATIVVANPVVSYAAPQEVEPGVWFDAEYYAANNPDVVAVFGTDPGMLYLHYKTYGKNEGRLPMAPTSTTTTTTTAISGIPAEYADCDGSPCIGTKPGKINNTIFYIYYGNFEEEVKSYMLQIINNERATLGKNPLILRDDLVSYSQIRANEIIDSYSHTRPDGSKIPKNYAECIYYIYTGETSYEVAYNLVQGYKNSPGHWSLLMGNYNYIGIGEITCLGTYYNTIINYNAINLCK